MNKFRKYSACKSITFEYILLDSGLMYNRRKMENNNVFSGNPKEA